MSKTRKILSVVLAVVLVFALSVPAFAYNWEAEDNGYTQTWALGEAEETGNTDEYTIDVSLTTDYATGAVQFELAFTGDVALTGVTLGDDYYENADLFKDNDTGKVMLIPTTSDPNALDAAEIDGVVAVLTVTGTHGTIAIVEDVKSEANQGGTLIAARLDPETLLGAQYVGQELVTVGDPVSLGMVPADLAIKAAYADSGIVIDTHKTFGGSYAGVVYGFARAAANTFRSKTYLNNSLEATNNGSLSIKASSGTAFCGTGTEITVLNADGSNSGKVYVVVIFGDLNGDAFINATDAGLARAAAKVASTYANNSLERMAANASVGAAAALMHTINGTDVTAITGQTKNGTTDYIGQANVAKQMAKFNNNYQ